MFFRKQSFKLYVKINFVNVANLYALRVILCVVYSQANTVRSYENKKHGRNPCRKTDRVFCELIINIVKSFCVVAGDLQKFRYAHITQRCDFFCGIDNHRAVATARAPYTEHRFQAEACQAEFPRQPQGCDGHF